MPTCLILLCQDVSFLIISQPYQLSQLNNYLGPASFGTSHFAEIGYVFYNTLSLGYASGLSPLENATGPVLELAKLVCHMWVSFIHDLDPNNHDSKCIDSCSKCFFD